MESITWRKPATWKRFGVATQEEAETQALFAFNQGFYNLFLAVIGFIGIGCVLKHDGASTAGWALVFASTGSMVGAAAILASCGRQYLRAAVTQGLFPALAIVVALLALNS